MDASIVHFPRDFGRRFSEATSLHAGMTVDDLLARQHRLRVVFAELLRKDDCSPAEIELLDRISNSSHAFHALARDAGIPGTTVDGFNERREDWKAWAKWRASLPPGRRI